MGRGVISSKICWMSWKAFWLGWIRTHVHSGNKTRQECLRYAVIFCPYSLTIHMIALSRNRLHFLLSIVSWAFMVQIFGCIALHQMWHSGTSDLLARGGVRLPDHMLCGDDVFLWATESCCAINLLLFSCYFFVCDDERRDFVATVDLYHRRCVMLKRTPALLHLLYDKTNMSSDLRSFGGWQTDVYSNKTSLLSFWVCFLKAPSSQSVSFHLHRGKKMKCEF